MLNHQHQTHDTIEHAGGGAQSLMPATADGTAHHHLTGQTGNSEELAAAAGTQTNTRLKPEVFCLVPACGFNLTESPYYLKRHRVCEAHMKAKTVTLEGVVSRFCQQCGRFQPLTDFNGERKSCDAALKAHNARRRQMNQDSAVLVNDRRSRVSHSSSRRSLHKDGSRESGEADGSGSRVSRRLAARRTNSFRSEQDLQAQQQHTRLVAAARRATHSDGDQACYRGSKSPSGSLQSFEDPTDSMRQMQHSQHSQHPQDSNSPGRSPGAGSTTPPSRSASPAAAAGSSGLQHAAAAHTAGHSVECGTLPLLHGQTGRFQMANSACTGALGTFGRSRLGMMAVSSGMAVSVPNAYAYAAGPGTQPHMPAQRPDLCSPSATALAVQQGTLAGWMDQHTQLQQASWLSGASPSAAAAAAAGGVAGTAYVFAVNPVAALSMPQPGLAMQPNSQQLPCMPQAYATAAGPQQQWQQPGWTGMAGPAAVGCCAGMVQQPLQLQQQGQLGVGGPLPPQLPQRMQPVAPPKQEQQQPQPLSQQQQDQAWLEMLLADAGDMDLDAAAAAAADDAGPAGSGTSARTASPAAAAASIKPPTPGAAAPAEQGSCEPSAEPQIKRSPASIEHRADAAAAALDADAGDSSGGTGAAASSAAASSDQRSGAGTAVAAHDDGLDAETAAILAAAAPPDEALDEALSMLDELLAADPDWRVAQESPPATSSGIAAAAAAGQQRNSTLGGSIIGHITNPSSKSDTGGLAPAGPAAVPVGAGVALLSSAGGAHLQPGVPAVPASMAAAGSIAACPLPAPGGVHNMLSASPAAPSMLQPGSMLAAHHAGVGVDGAAGQQPMSPLHAASLGLGSVSDPGGAPQAAAGMQQQLAPQQLFGQPQQPGGSSMGWGAEPNILQGVAPGAGVQGAVAWPLNEPTQSNQVLPPDARLALLQQEQLLAQQQLLQQQELQRLHFQQQQQLLLQQQAAQRQHQLVRLSIKLHGVTPDQLPSSTVLALEQVLQQHAGHMEAVMMQPAFREGCVQMELDILVKPQGPIADSQHAPQQQEFAGLSEASAGTGAGTGGWDAVLDAVSACPARAAAEAELRGALPFSVLLEVLLAQPLLSDSADTESVSSEDIVAEQRGWGTRSNSSSDNRDGADSDSSSVADGGEQHTLSSRVHAVYAQLGDCMGIWTATRGLVQDWITLAVDADQHAASDSSSGRPRILEAGRLCTAAGKAAGPQSPGAQVPAEGTTDAAASLLQLSMTVQAGSSEAVAFFGADDETPSHSDSSNSSLASISLRRDSSEAPAAEQDMLQAWCTCRGAFLPVVSCAGAGPSSGPPTAGIGVVRMEAVVDTPPAGLLQLQLEQDSARNTARRQQQQHHSHADNHPRHQQDPVPIMGKLMPVVVCPSDSMASEVDAVLSSVLDASSAGHWLQRLGLVLDFWSMQQELRWATDQGVPLSERQQWCCGLLSNALYLGAVRSFCQQWLVLAHQHSMPATLACLRSIWSSMHAGAAAVESTSDDGSQQQTGPDVEGPAASASTGGVTAAAPGVRNWVFEDVDCSTSRPQAAASSRSSARPASAGGATSGSKRAAASASNTAGPGTRVLLGPLMTALAMVLLWLGALKLTAGGSGRVWLPLLRMKLLLQAAVVPLVVLSAGGVLAMWVLRQGRPNTPLPCRPPPAPASAGVRKPLGKGRDGSGSLATVAE